MVGETKQCTCCLCGGEILVDIETEHEDGRLGCIPFTGPERALLTGVLRMRGQEPIYVTFDGRHLTRAEAVAEVGEAEVQHIEARTVRGIMVGRRAE